MPDVLVKGADYGLDQVICPVLVTQRGGKAVLGDLMSGHGTSNIAKRLPAAASV